MKDQYKQYIHGTTAVIPYGITEIEAHAFEDCSSLTSIEIPDSVTEIEEYAFAGCTSLTSIEIPNSVTVIGGRAFERCIDLTSIEIPDSVTEIGECAFRLCTSLTHLEIPDGVTIIKSFTFAVCSNLISIEIPYGITEIKYGAFRECSALTSIEIPDSVTEIGECAFAGCTSLTSIEIPNSVTKISGAFAGCSSLSSIEIPDSVTEIVSSAFCDCTSLNSIEIPNSVTKIGWYAFKGCTSLTSIEIPDSVTEIGMEAFADCSSLTSIEIPDSVTILWWSVFKRCTSLTSIVIPYSLKNISFPIIEDCYNLEHIFVDHSNPRYKSVNNCLLSRDGSRLFHGCKSSIIPNSVRIIEEGAFSGCPGLTSIEIPDSVTEIGKYAFAGCTNLTRIEIHYIKPQLAEIINNSFGYLDLSRISLHVPIGTGYAYRHHPFFSQFKEVIPDHSVTSSPQSPIPKSTDNGPYYLFFDTETTGRPQYFNAPSSDIANWPRLVQLSWILTNEKGLELVKENHIIKPSGFIIPQNATAIHGITTEQALSTGEQLSDVINRFISDFEKCTIIIGHNISFDKKIVGAELIRLGREDIMNQKRSICTMESSVNFCRILDIYGRCKYPSLQELHLKLFGTQFEDAHNSASDVAATEKCFWEMQRRGVI